MDKLYKRKKVRLKQPPKRFEPDRCQWVKTERNHWKSKVAYESEDKAEEWLKQHPKLIEQGMVSYECSICHKWHCGHKENDV